MANILIIDDDKSVCEAIIFLISSIDHTGICSHSLIDGLEKVSTEDVDLVF